MNMSEITKEITKSLRCSWKDAKEMIDHAERELKLDNSKNAKDNNREEILEKVAELWKTRKPTAEEIEAKKKKKEAGALEQERLEQRRKRAKQLQKDADFRWCIYIAASCGVVFLANSLFECRKRKTIEEYMEEIG
jgi:type IV secretory pathway component VirB8